MKAKRLNNDLRISIAMVLVAVSIYGLYIAILATRFYH